MTRDTEAMTAVRVPSWVVPHLEVLRLAVRTSMVDESVGQMRQAAEATVRDEPETWAAGQSLGFIRRVTGQPARFSSALEALTASPLLPGPAPIGAYVWFDNEPHGDVGLSLGSGQMLCITSHGRPGVQPVYLHDNFVGWSWTIGQ